MIFCFYKKNLDLVNKCIIIDIKGIFMGQIVYSDGSSLFEKIENFRKFRSKSGKHFKEMTLWENSDYGCHYADDSDYIDLITEKRQKIQMPKEECEGLFKLQLPRRNIEKSLKLKYYSAGQNNNDLIVECYLTDSQDENNPHIIKEIYSFVSSMINKDPNKIVQLQRYDLNGKYLHQNKIIGKLAENKIIFDEEIELLTKYFCETVQFPHFHFSSNTFKDSLAISLDNLIRYIFALITANENDMINKFSLGMPFLKIKQQGKYSQINVTSFVDKVDNRLNKLAQKYGGIKERRIIEKINNVIHSLDLADLTTNSIEACLYKLFILKVLNDSSSDGFFKKYSDEIFSNNDGSGGVPNSNSNFDDIEGDYIEIDPKFIDDLNNLQLQIADKITTDLEIEKIYDRDNDKDDGREL